MKKGFTLIEILAVLIIIGVLLGLAIPSTIFIRRRANENLYCTRIAIIEANALRWGRNNEEVLKIDEEAGLKTTIAINELINLGYINEEEIIDPRTNEPINYPVTVLISENQVYSQIRGAVEICGGEELRVPVTNFTVNPTNVNLELGGAANLRIQTIEATITPPHATNRNVTWSSSNNVIATVNQNGVLTAVSPGRATITASLEGITREINVTVTQRVTALERNPHSTRLPVGNTTTITANPIPDNANDRSVTWSSNNPGVATVNQNGVITAVSRGNATITVRTLDGGRTATVTVRVQRPVELANVTQSRNVRNLRVTASVNNPDGRTGYTYSFNGGAWTNNNFIDIGTNGNHTVNVRVRDAGGHITERTLGVSRFVFGFVQARPNIGMVQNATIPANRTCTMELWGACGWVMQYCAGMGGYTSGVRHVSAATTFHVFVGGRGTTSCTEGTTIPGGWNGGGNATAFRDCNNGSGGGATDIRINGTTLNHRIMVAGGGGGDVGTTTTTSRGHGGGLVGISGTSGGNVPFHTATGGTQTTGGIGTGGGAAFGLATCRVLFTDNIAISVPGSFGQGGNGAIHRNRAGGGGGWFGGASMGCSGGGGSSHIASGHFSNPRNIAGNQAMPNHNANANMIGNAGHGVASIMCIEP